MRKDFIETITTDPSKIEGAWKVNDEEMDQLMFYDFEGQRKFTKLPEKYYGPARIIDLYDQYQIIVPISKWDSIKFLKNFYSDLNIKVYCDADDNRDECDIRSNQTFDYYQLSNKTFDMFNYACKNLQGYKFYAKMDFDTYLDKSYVYGVIKFVSDNSDRRIYYGNPILRSGRIFNGGNFYAISGSLFRDYCSCDIRHPLHPYEDEWYGEVIKLCFNSKNYKNKNLIYMKNDETKILHKHYNDDGVDLKLGSWVVKE
ncbi:hypothetical protein AYI68_g6424 [Smittium mucronatum]|uniref:Hexosyltransferase n=1 Tax=Smittium mucronatum TaxID=133383 RepID=A0A1R0GRK0_9FUNG|nr:hypothetical protein AYI68_g6424 [Smittium mucronatum]